MGYVYAVLWLVVGMILIFKMGRENKAFYVVGGYFLFWGIWQALNEILDVNLYDGIYGWIHKGIAIVVLGVCILVVYTERKRGTAKILYKDNNNDNDENNSK